MENGWIPTIITTVAGLAIGIISFFLKRTISQVDRLDICKASKDEMDTLDKRVDGVVKSIGDIKTNFLTKEDFFREQEKTDRKLDNIKDDFLRQQANTDRKLDKIMEILLDIKGGGNNG